jgi:hypothetical protein
MTKAHNQLRYPLAHIWLNVMTALCRALIGCLCLLCTHISAAAPANPGKELPTAANSAIGKKAAARVSPRVEQINAPQNAPFGWDATPLAVESGVVRDNKLDAASNVIRGDHEAVVLSTMEAPGFNTVYVELESNGKKFWIASRLTQIQVGNMVRFSGENLVGMDNFESKALKRTFEKIYFIPSLTVVENQ